MIHILILAITVGTFCWRYCTAKSKHVGKIHSYKKCH